MCQPGDKTRSVQYTIYRSHFQGPSTPMYEGGYSAAKAAGVACGHFTLLVSSYTLSLAGQRGNREPCAVPHGSGHRRG